MIHFSEKVSSFDDDNLVALEAYETFSHFSNLDRSLGEMVRTSLNLKRTSCRVHDQASNSTIQTEKKSNSLCFVVVEV